MAPGLRDGRFVGGGAENERERQRNCGELHIGEKERGAERGWVRGRYEAKGNRQNGNGRGVVIRLPDIRGLNHGNAHTTCPLTYGNSVHIGMQFCTTPSPPPRGNCELSFDLGRQVAMVYESSDFCES